MNLNKGMPSVSVGDGPFTLNVGKNGARGTAGLHGMGLSMSEQVPWRRSRAIQQAGSRPRKGWGWWIFVATALFVWLAHHGRPLARMPEPPAAVASTWQDSESQSATKAATEPTVRRALPVEDPRLPRHDLTPGEALPATLADICRPGYARSIRHVTTEMRREVFSAPATPKTTAYSV
jgi:hypothetical protein